MKYLRSVFAAHPLGCVAALCLIPLTVCTCRAIEAWRSVGVTVQRTTADLPEAMLSVVLPALRIVDSRTSQIADTVTIMTVKTENDAAKALNRTLDTAQAGLQDTFSRADRALTALEGIQGSVQPILASVEASTGHMERILAQTEDVATKNLVCHGNGNCWPAGVTAALGGLKVTLGEAAQAARRIDGAVPEMLATVQKIGDNSDLATARTAEAQEQYRLILYNLQETTKPLPKWLRYPLGIAGLMMPIAVGAVGINGAIQ